MAEISTEEMFIAEENEVITPQTVGIPEGMT
jgi:hypothetical protein